MSKKILAIFLARGGSKRIKNKNILTFFSKPIIQYGLHEAKKSKLFSKIHVSTESIKIRKIVNKLGFDIDFLRPKKLAGDKIESVEVIKYIIDEYKKRGLKFDIIFNIMPASPLIKSSDFHKALQIFKKKKMKYPLQVFSKYPAPIEWAFNINKNQIAKPIYPSKILKLSQSFKNYYYESGPFSIFPISIFEKNKKFSFIKKGFLPYILPNYRAVDIDSLEDLKMAKALFKEKAKNK